MCHLAGTAYSSFLLPLLSLLQSPPVNRVIIAKSDVTVVECLHRNATERRPMQEIEDRGVGSTRPVL
uniref:Putative secreted protein n=1 Tax=Anopheles darlingi TaxID=43151 RepID=A0A2M4D2Q2_ANODA